MLAEVHLVQQNTIWTLLGKAIKNTVFLGGRNGENRAIKMLLFLLILLAVPGEACSLPPLSVG